MDISSLVDECINIIMLFSLIHHNGLIKVNEILISSQRGRILHRGGINSFVLNGTTFSWVIIDDYWIYKYDRDTDKVLIWNKGWDLADERHKQIAYDYLHNIYMMLLNLVTFRIIQIMESNN